MNMFRNITLACSLLSALALPAAGSVNISSPANGSQVNSPFNLAAGAPTCSSRNVVVVGYSLDNSADTSLSAGQWLNASISSGTGWHTVHVKAWNDWGGVCVTDVAVNVASGSSTVPGNAVSVSGIQALGNWEATNDSASGGWSSGWMNLVNAPSMSGNARIFVTNYSNHGGERYHVTFGDDNTSQNFLYDAWLYIAGNSDSIANVEMDLNQTMPNGQTAIMGFQCDGWSRTWDYTVNGGSPQSPVDKWMHSYAACNPHSWGANQWHHVQISYSRNDSGWVTYKSVWLDGAQQDINITAFSGFALGWAPTLLTNFQVDGANGGGGSATVYLDNLTIYRW